MAEKFCVCHICIDGTYSHACMCTASMYSHSIDSALLTSGFRPIVPIGRVAQVLSTRGGAEGKLQLQFYMFLQLYSLQF